MGKMVEQTPLTLEIRGSNPTISKTFHCQPAMMKIGEKESGHDPLRDLKNKDRAKLVDI